MNNIVKFVCFIIQIICLIICTISVISTARSYAEIKRINEMDKPKKEKKRRKVILSLRQFIALHCKKNVFIIGARRTGKSFAAVTKAIRTQKKGKDVIFITETHNLINHLYHAVMDRCSGCGNIKYRSIVTKNGYGIHFFTIDELDKINMFLRDRKSCPIVIMDEIIDPYTAYSELVRIEKDTVGTEGEFFITCTPFSTLTMSSDNCSNFNFLPNFKVFKWSLSKRFVKKCEKKCITKAKKQDAK